MPLQNRVDPCGDLHAVDARGMFTGNRGVIHDPETRKLSGRDWTTKAWIICDCGWKGRKREVFGRNTPSGGAGWTNLFFLDEVTALSAGHRPCFECRREKAKEFADCFGKAFDVAKVTVDDIDERLHAERLASGGPLLDVSSGDAEQLPEGTMIFQGERFFARKGEKDILGWSFWQYGDDFSPYELALYDIWVATPATTIEVLRVGYQPVWHPSAAM